MSNILINLEDIQELIAKVPNHVNLTFVGGQAVSFWATFYSEKYPSLFEIAQDIVTGTSDIDIVASGDDAKACAQAWDAKISMPEPFDNTPNTAIVHIYLPGKGNIEIDFLDDYVKIHDVKDSHYSNTKLSNDKSIYILSPLSLLLAKLGNTLILRRTDKHALGHLRCAVLIMNCQIKELVESNELSSVYKIIDLLLHLARQMNIGGKLYNTHQIDLLKAIPSELESLDERFIQKTYLPKLLKIKDKRKLTNSK